jgi:hypothetical protein
MPSIGPAPMAELEVNELPYLIFTLTLIDRNNNSPSHQVGKYE